MFRRDKSEDLLKEVCTRAPGIGAERYDRIRTRKKAAAVRHGLPGLLFFSALPGGWPKSYRRSGPPERKMYL